MSNEDEIFDEVVEEVETKIDEVDEVFDEILELEENTQVAPITAE